MEAHERLHARYFYEAYKQIADELNKLEDDKVRCPQKCGKLAKKYLNSVLSYYRMKQAYEDAKLHKDTYSYKSLTRQFRHSYFGENGHIEKGAVFDPPDEDSYRYSSKYLVRQSGSKEHFLNELKDAYQEKVLLDYEKKLKTAMADKKEALEALMKCIGK